MPEPWKTPEMKSWAQRYLEDERQQGRLYWAIYTDEKDKFEQPYQHWELHETSGTMNVREFPEQVKKFLAKNADGAEVDVENLSRAIQVYVRDDIQKGMQGDRRYV